jgi:hypothetical protein
MRRTILFWFTAAPVFAHMMSMSSGDALLEGARLRYELRMPAYEIQHMKDPQRELFDHIAFAGARLISKQCVEDAGALRCNAEYAFPAPVEALNVECTFYQVTVPNHVHLLRAQMGDKRDQAIFDYSFSTAALRFRPPTAFETFVTQTGGGVARALGGWAQALFLAALAIAARSRRELASLAATFFVGQALSAALVPRTGFEAAPRFVEAACALTIAYLAVEILLLPKAGARWAVAGVLGAFHGLYFDLFVRTSGYSVYNVLLGATVAEALLLIVLAFLFSRIGRLAAAAKPVQVAASLLLAVGMGWFFWRMLG